MLVIVTGASGSGKTKIIFNLANHLLANKKVEGLIQLFGYDVASKQGDPNDSAYNTRSTHHNMIVSLVDIPIHYAGDNVGARFSAITRELSNAKGVYIMEAFDEKLKPEDMCRADLILQTNPKEFSERAIGTVFVRKNRFGLIGKTFPYSIDDSGVLNINWES